MPAIGFDMLPLVYPSAANRHHERGSESKKMSQKLRATETDTLLPFLKDHLPDWTRSKIKKRLQAGCVYVNGEPVAKHDHELQQGDEVEVRAKAKYERSADRKLEVLYSDRDLVAINKPRGLLSVATDSERKEHALALLRDQLSTPKHPVKLWPVHRLDRETSGVLLFATSREAREAVADDWSQAEKIYLAIVEGCPDPGRGTIDQPLWQGDRDHRVHVGEHPEAKRAVTHFETQRSTKRRALLTVSLETGRQHQIRAHLAWLGHPVIGDARYGTGGRRMGLHALRLGFTDPRSREWLTVEAPAPDDFLDLI